MFVTDLLITDEQEGGLNEHYTLEEGVQSYEVRPGQYVQADQNNDVGTISFKVYLKVPNGVPENSTFYLDVNSMDNPYQLSDFTEGEYAGGYTHCLTISRSPEEDTIEYNVTFSMELHVVNNTEEEGHPATQTSVELAYFGAMIGNEIFWIGEEDCSDQGPYLLDVRAQNSPTPVEVEGTTFGLQGFVGWEQEANGEYAITPRLKVYEVQSNSEDYLIGTSTDDPETACSEFLEFTVDREAISDPDLRTGNYRMDIVNEGETIRSYKFSIIDKQPEPEEPGE